MLKRSILICDSDQDFVNATLQQAPPHIAFVGATNAIEAQHKIVDRSSRLAAICINPAIASPDAIPLIRFAHLHRPAVPVSLISGDSAFPPPGFDPAALHVQKILRRPIEAKQLVAELIPANVFEIEKAIELGKDDETAAGASALHEDGEMHAIEADNFLCGSKSFFDVYVRISDRKYLKILKTNDQFDAERVNTYLRKGVRHFYIRKNAQQYFLQYCDKITGAVVAKSGISDDVKQRQVQNLGKETSEQLRSMGLSEANVHSAARFVEHTHRLIDNLDLGGQRQLQEFVTRLKECDHSAGTAMIVSLLLDSLNFRDPDVIATIALGAFLHDIGLYLLPENLGSKRYRDLTVLQKETYETHPGVGAEIVARIPTVNPLVVQIVKQHHERRNRKGYPAKLGPGAIAPMAEIVGIADTFQELLSHPDPKPGSDPLAAMETDHFDNFSFQTVDGFRRAFLLRKK